MPQQGFAWRRPLGLMLGIILFALVLLLPAPSGMPPAAKSTAAVALLMTCWWLSEAIDIAATSLLPLVLFPLLKILPIKEVAPSYADANIFLFMGGFFIAMAMQKWALHRRIALHIIRIVGVSPARLVLGFMLATGFISCWISNTATTILMTPIGISVILYIQGQIKKTTPEFDPLRFNLATDLMLGIAYAASIGGVATLIGTPPNLIFKNMAEKIFPAAPEITFAQWLAVGLPFAIVFLPIAWLLLTKAIYPIKLKTIPGGREIVLEELKRLGKMSRGEIQTLAIFIFAAIGWIFSSDITIGSWRIPGWTSLLGLAGFASDASVAMIAAILLFILPVDLKRGEFTLDWEWAKRIPWGVLILFGGGLALADGFRTSGLARWLGESLGFFSFFSPLAMIALVSLITVLVGELTSNTAQATIFLPILATTAVAMKIHPFLLMIPATVSASCGFMLPVATPPNAIVFGSGYVSFPQMAKAGFILDMVGVLVVTLLIYTIGLSVFNINPQSLPNWAF